MTADGHKHSFREDLRRTLLGYAVVSIAASAVLLVGILGIVMIHSIIGGCSTDARAQADRLEQIHSDYTEALLSLANGLDLNRYRNDAAYQAEMNRSVYRFINGGDVSSAFYLVDEKDTLVFSTENRGAERRSAEQLLHWQVTRAFARTRDRVISLTSRVVQDENEKGLFVVACRLSADADAAGGYACFVFTGDALPMNEMVSSPVIAGHYGTVLHAGVPILTGSLGKLRADVRGKTGFCLNYGRLRYVAFCSVKDGLFEVYAVRDCVGLLMACLTVLGVSVAMVFAFSVFMFFSTERIAREKTALLDRIADACLRVRNSDLTVRLDIRSDDEFEVIGEAFNGMMDSMNSLMERSITLARENTVSRLKQLEAEFNPHFLFNTLENIRFMIRLDPKTATEMIKELSALLRYSIRTEQTVTLAHNSEYTRHYLGILEKRFGERLIYQLDIPESLGCLLIPPLIMQPIIENAVKYGMEARDVLTVRVSAEQQSEVLILRVSDNGAGIRSEMLSELQRMMAQPGTNRTEHVGILNVHERIRLMYGEPYGVTIRSGESGSTVELRLPALREEE